jgi:hypothetical protein
METNVFNNKEEIINFLFKLAENKNNVYRGYKQDLEMLPYLLRYEKYIDKEFLLLKDFEFYATSYHNSKNTLDFIANAQHYGLPTRMLDFTYNPFISLFFSLFNKSKNNYYYIRYCSLCDNIIIPELFPGLTPFSYEIESFSEGYRKRVGFFESEIINFKNDG